MDREKFERLMGVIFTVNSTTEHRILFSYDALSETIKLVIHEDGYYMTQEKVTLSLDYTLIENDYLYVLAKCKELLENKEDSRCKNQKVSRI
jgi:hypothetical protein